MVLVGLMFTATGAAAQPGKNVTDITDSPKGRELTQRAAQKITKEGGIDTPVQVLRAWEIRTGEYVVAERMPRNFTSTVTTSPDGATRVELSYETESADIELAAATTAATPEWGITAQGCFSWISNTYGELLPCYKLRKMKYETFTRDYFSLEQYGTVQAKAYPYAKIYDGWVAAVKASSSSAMAWEDWDPLGDISGSCQSVPLGIDVRGIIFGASGFMCEVWDMQLYTDAGHFRQKWSCGCVVPFGQSYPASRGMKYLQAISTAGGGNAVWTLSAGFLASNVR